MTYRVGVIGCGRKGTSHARAYALNPATEVIAAADTISDAMGGGEPRVDRKSRRRQR